MSRSSLFKPSIPVDNKFDIHINKDLIANVHMRCSESQLSQLLNSHHTSLPAAKWETTKADQELKRQHFNYGNVNMKELFSRALGIKTDAKSFVSITKEFLSKLNAPVTDETLNTVSATLQRLIISKISAEANALTSQQNKEIDSKFAVVHDFYQVEINQTRELIADLSKDETPQAKQIELLKSKLIELNKRLDELSQKKSEHVQSHVNKYFEKGIVDIQKNKDLTHDITRFVKQVFYRSILDERIVKCLNPDHKITGKAMLMGSTIAKIAEINNTMSESNKYDRNTFRETLTDQLKKIAVTIDPSEMNIILDTMFRRSSDELRSAVPMPPSPSRR